jgi:hypothetical protein
MECPFFNSSIVVFGNRIFTAANWASIVESELAVEVTAFFDLQAMVVAINTVAITIIFFICIRVYNVLEWLITKLVTK